MTMLPSGMEVRLEEVPVVEMVRSGFLPGQLRALAMRFASTEGADLSALDAKERDEWAALERLMIARWVVAVRWTCPCVDCVARRGEAGIEQIEEQAYRIDPERLAADPPPLPRVDLVALSDLVTFARTPRQVDALSRVAHGQLASDEAARIVEAEVPNTLTGWASFRDLRRGLDAHAHGTDVGQPAVGVPGPNRAARRAAAHRRRPRGALDPGARPGAGGVGGS